MATKLSKSIFAVLFVITSWQTDSYAQDSVWKQHMQAAATAHRRSDFDKALREGQAGLKAAESIDLDGPPMAKLVTYLAVLYGFNGQKNQAEMLYKRGLEIRERTLGIEHLEVADSLNKLGIFYQSRGLFLESASVLERALTIRKATLGAQHRTTRSSRSRLILTYGQLDRHSDADTLRKNIVPRNAAGNASISEDAQVIQWNRDLIPTALIIAPFDWVSASAG